MKSAKMTNWHSPPFKLTGRMCFCSACGEAFSTESNFSAHRGGRYGVDRKCLKPATVGLIQDSRGIWKGPPPANKHWERPDA